MNARLVILGARLLLLRKVAYGDQVEGNNSLWDFQQPAYSRYSFFYETDAQPDRAETQRGRCQQQILAIQKSNDDVKQDRQ